MSDIGPRPKRQKRQFGSRTTEASLILRRTICTLVYLLIGKQSLSSPKFVTEVKMLYKFVRKAEIRRLSLSRKIFLVVELLKLVSHADRTSSSAVWPFPFSRIDVFFPTTLDPAQTFDLQHAILRRDDRLHQQSASRRDVVGDRR